MYNDNNLDIAVLGNYKV